jgi:tetratricopeptide (TPR) repeat protein
MGVATRSLRLVAYLRGLAWSRLGEWSAAVEFFQEAVRVSPYQQSGYIHCYLGALLALDRAEQAITLAEQVAAEDRDPLLLLDAAEVFFVRSTELNDAHMESMLRLARNTAQRGLRLAAEAKQSDMLREQCVRTHLWLALDHARMNDSKSAEAAVDAARSLHSDELSVLLIEKFLKQRRRSNSWDHGLGSCLVYLRGVPGFSESFTPSLNAIPL